MEVCGVPGWATDWLRRQGYAPGNVMDGHIQRWWGWYACDNDWYSPAGAAGDELHATIHPARTVCDEWASLLMNEKTELGSDDAAMAAWLGEAAPGFVEDNADFVSRAFALGSGAWACDVVGASEDGPSGAARARVRRYGAEGIVPLATDGDGASVSCAFVGRCAVGGRVYDQLQVHEPGDDGLYQVRTWLFVPGAQAAPVAVPSVAPLWRTGSELPTYAIATPAVANTYEAHTPLGVSVFDCGVGAVKAVDEAFDLLYWSMRLGKTRVMVDERALVVDRETGEVKGLDTVDKRLYRTLEAPVDGSQPVTVFNPDLRAGDIARDIDLALSLLSLKCGFGQAYFSFDGHQGIRTATEVSADNSQLFRNVRRHENRLGAAIERAVRGAWAMERAARTGLVVRDGDVPPVEVRWDDSIVTDTASERAMMKDDIARGLCPPWLYPMRYYGLSKTEAKALTSGAGFPEEM